jgi:hypothetical protein
MLHPLSPFGRRGVGTEAGGGGEAAGVDGKICGFCQGTGFRYYTTVPSFGTTNCGFLRPNGVPMPLRVYFICAFCEALK